MLYDIVIKYVKFLNLFLRYYVKSKLFLLKHLIMLLLFFYTIVKLIQIVKLCKPFKQKINKYNISCI